MRVGRAHGEASGVLRLHAPCACLPILATLQENQLALGGIKVYSRHSFRAVVGKRVCCQQAILFNVSLLHTYYCSYCFQYRY